MDDGEGCHEWLLVDALDWAGWMGGGCFRRFEWMAFFLRRFGFFAGTFCSDPCVPGDLTYHSGRAEGREMNCNWDNGTLESDETTTWERPERWTLRL